MARVKAEEACIFCGSSPCSCLGSSPPPKTARKPRKKPETSESSEVESQPAITQSIQRASMRDFMKQDAAVKRPEKKYEVYTPSPTKIADQRSDEEKAFAAAVKALSPLLHPVEVKRYAMILNTGPATAEEKAAQWRLRNVNDGSLSD